MYISFIVSIRSSLHHVHGFKLVVLLPYLTKITFFVCTNRINFLNLKEVSDKLAIFTKGFFKQPNSHMLVKQKESIISQKLGSQDFFFKLLRVFWAIENILVLFHSLHPSFCWGIEPSTTFSKRRGLTGS